LKRHGFEVDETVVRQIIEYPIRVDRRGDQLLAVKPIDQEHAIGVIYEEVNDNIMVMTFYHVKRERFNV